MFVQGQHLTHERMISLVANQIGSSHEGDKVAQELQFLRGIFINNQPIFFETLSQDAKFTLEVGERVIEKAMAVYKFKRKPGVEYGNLSIAVRVNVKVVFVDSILTASFESDISRVKIFLSVSDTHVRFEFIKHEQKIANVQAPLLSEWRPGAIAVFCLSYSSQHEQARIIINGIAIPEVEVPLGFVDIREIRMSHVEVSDVLETQLVLVHERFMRPDEIKQLTDSEPPYYGGVFEPDDSEDRVFP